MLQAPENVNQALIHLLPQSVIKDVACFVFYDNHPRDQRCLDIIICTRKGEIKEFYQRELLNSILIQNIIGISEILIIRNTKCDLFYLVVAQNEIIIISKKETLQLCFRISNVDKYKFEEASCRGLKIFCNDDAVPVIFDDDMNKLEDADLVLLNEKSEDSLPIINQLKRKLVEAKYTTKHNENILNDYIKLRQLAAFQMYKKTQLNSNVSAFKLDQSEISKALQVQTQAPIVRLCNRKFVMLSSIVNKNEHELDDISVLLHGTSRPSIEYKTKFFIQIPTSPFWSETKSMQSNSEEKCTLVTIVDVDEIKNDTEKRIDFDVIISLKLKGTDYLLPLDSVSISALDMMEEKFEMLADETEDSSNIVLSILATSETIDLCLRHFGNNENTVLTPAQLFRDYLKMEKLTNIDNVFIYKKSPHHILYGVMVVVEENNELVPNHIMNVKVYVRCTSQVLQLIHFIYDSVPHKIIATTPDYELTARVSELSKYNEKKSFTLNYSDCAVSVTNQIKIIQEHINDCLVKITAESSGSELTKEVDLLAQGVPKYLEFRKKLLEESIKGMKCLNFVSQTLPDTDSDIMIIDD